MNDSDPWEPSQASFDSATSIQREQREATEIFHRRLRLINKMSSTGTGWAQLRQHARSLETQVILSICR